MNILQLHLKTICLLPLTMGLLGIVAQSANAASVLESCPRQIGEMAVNLAGGPAGWSAYSPQRLPLQAAGFMAGQPSTKTDLKPDSTEKHGRSEISTWKFDPELTLKPDGLWLSCAYGDGGALTLSRKIANGFSECTVTYAEKRAGVDRDIRVSCK